MTDPKEVTTKEDKTLKSFRLDDKTCKALEMLSEITKRSQAQMVEFAVDYYCKHFPELMNVN